MYEDEWIRIQELSRSIAMRLRYPLSFRFEIDFTNQNDVLISQRLGTKSCPPNKDNLQENTLVKMTRSKSTPEIMNAVIRLRQLHISPLSLKLTLPRHLFTIISLERPSSLLTSRTFNHIDHPLNTNISSNQHFINFVPEP